MTVLRAIPQTHTQKVASIENRIIHMLTKITKRSNDEVKIAAIQSLGAYKATIEQENAITRLIELSEDPNKEVAVSAIRSLGMLSQYFHEPSKY